MQIRRYDHGFFILIVFLVIAGAPFGRAAAQGTPEAGGAIRIVSPAKGDAVTGRDVAIAWEAPGLTIVAAKDATSEDQLHAHFIVDGAAEVTAGAPIPTQCGVLHTAANPATLTNLPPGEHTVELVIANPGHVPVEGLERPSVTFTVVEDEEAIRITSPENCAEVTGPDVAIAWEAPGLTIVPAKEAQNEDDLHAHFIVDDAYAIVEGAPIPVETAGILHTAANPATIEGLTPGPQTIQLVIANPGHVPVEGLARPKVTVIVGGEEGAAGDTAPATPAGAAQAGGGEPDSAAGAAGTGDVTVTSDDIFFEPTEIAIPAETDVAVSLPNDGVTQHNFSIDELGIDVDIEAGATEEVVINAPAGTYEFYCNVPGHKAAGMAGTLTVE
jgi:plastocyanin